MAATARNNADIYLTHEEFCERYNIKPRTAQRWRAIGEGPKWLRLGLRRVSYRLSDCEDWAARRTFSNRADELAQRAA